MNVSIETLPQRRAIDSPTTDTVMVTRTPIVTAEPRPRRVRNLRDVLTQFALIGAAALAYFGVRGLTEGSEATAVANARRVLDVEAFFGLDVEASLQRFILGHREIVTAANWVYIWGHWPVIVATLVWLYRKHRDSYTLLRNAMFISGAIGLAIFMAFPVAPPRLMPSGFVDTVTELSNSYRVLQPPSLVNKYAAVPSLHVGWNLLVGVVVFRTVHARWAKALAATGPLLMAAAVVLTANHYVVDAVAGSAVALTGLAAAVLMQRVLACRTRQSSWTPQPAIGDCSCIQLAFRGTGGRARNGSEIMAA